jgi:cytochrome c oxidase cbb3-type subunit III
MCCLAKQVAIVPNGRLWRLLQSVTLRANRPLLARLPEVIPMRSPVSLAAAAALFLLVVAVHPSAQGGAAPPQGGGGRGGGGRAVFPAQQRPPGDPALIARGNGLYGVHCRACHGGDLRGGDQGGPNLLRSNLVLNDQAGELIGPVVLNGQQGSGGTMPPIRVSAEDARAIAEYIHSVAATMRGQGNPPPGPAAVLNVLVGDAAAGAAYFNARCGACHSATGDLRGIGGRLSDPTALQNYWLSGGGRLGRGGRGGRGRPIPVTVTTAPGQKIEGTLIRLDDFYVVVELADGTQRTFRREGERPQVDVRDPLEPHKQLLSTYTDSDIHNLTAYLVTLK